MKQNLITLSIFTAFVIIEVACAGTSVKPVSPCPGQYCIAVTIPELPGSPEVCYSTAAELAMAKASLSMKGDAGVNSNQNP
jgi:hypothetical protein